MGREIRRVPPNWQHPVRDCPHSPWVGGCGTAKANNGKCYKPQHATQFDEAVIEWNTARDLWMRGLRNDFDGGAEPHEEPCTLEAFVEYQGDIPQYEDHVDYKGVEPTWYQAYQTVSEGTPVSPPFATEEELIDYLAANGDFWDQSRGDKPPSRKAAMLFPACGNQHLRIVVLKVKGVTQWSRAMGRG